MQQILNSLIYGIEGADPLLTGAVLLRQMSGNKLELIAAPSLEPATRQTLLEAEKHVGSGICGQALLSGERIVFTDFRHHPCPACRNLGMLPQFAACWAEPMRNRQGEIIGVFALYNRHPVHPDLNQIALLTGGHYFRARDCPADTFCQPCPTRYRTLPGKAGTIDGTHQLAGGSADNFGNRSRQSDSELQCSIYGPQWLQAGSIIRQKPVWDSEQSDVTRLDAGIVHHRVEVLGWRVVVTQAESAAARGGMGQY